MSNKPPLEKILGINPLVKVDEEEAKLPTLSEGDEQEQFQADFDKARANISHVINQTNKAMTHMFNIAKEREDPKSFEALDRLLKTLAQTSKDLLEVHAMKKTFNEGSSNAQPAINNGTVIQNAVFTGTPAEFRQYLKDKEAAEQPTPVIEAKPEKD